MSFEGKYSVFTGKDDEWDEIWTIARGKGTKWETSISQQNWETARKCFLANKGNVKLLSQTDFDQKYADLKEKGADGNVAGVTNKPEHSIYLRADKDDPRDTSTTMFYALHEIIHWLSFPPNQGNTSAIKAVLRTGLTEALVSVVVDELLQGEKYRMDEPSNGVVGASIRDQDRKSYSNIMPVVSTMISQFGRPLLGGALFSTTWPDLAHAIQKQWNILPTSRDFVTAMTPLWTAANNSQGDEAIKQLKALMARPPLTQPGQQSRGQAASRP
jgi:hypothetical protein